MKDIDLIDLLATRIELCSSLQGWNYAVVAKQQPTQQGVRYNGTIYYERLYDIPRGQAQTTLTYDSVNRYFVETEVTPVSTLFQISALVIQDPIDLTIPTPSDVVNTVRNYLMSKSTIREFRKNGNNVGIMYVPEVRNIYFEDDRHRNESAPAIDVTLTHDRTITNIVPAVYTATGVVVPVL